MEVLKSFKAAILNSDLPVDKTLGDSGQSKTVRRTSIPSANVPRWPSGENWQCNRIRQRRWTKSTNRLLLSVCPFVRTRMQPEIEIPNYLLFNLVNWITNLRCRTRRQQRNPAVLVRPKTFYSFRQISWTFYTRLRWINSVRNNQKRTTGGNNCRPVW
jgi:hypothetical protein